MNKVYEKLSESEIVSKLKVNKKTYLLYLLFFLIGYFFGSIVSGNVNVINANGSTKCRINTGHYNYKTEK